MRLRSVLVFPSGRISLIRWKRTPGNSMISGWNGVEVSMLCRKNITFGPVGLRKQSWTSIFERALIWMCKGFSTRNLWATDIALLGQDVTHTREYKEADVIHLHWVNQGFISLAAVKKMLDDGKKVVWTMHDAWNSMGAYHLKIQQKEMAFPSRPITDTFPEKAMS